RHAERRMAGLLGQGDRFCANGRRQAGFSPAQTPARAARNSCPSRARNPLSKLWQEPKDIRETQTMKIILKMLLLTGLVLGFAGEAPAKPSDGGSKPAAPKRKADEIKGKGVAKSKSGKLRKGLARKGLRKNYRGFRYRVWNARYRTWLVYDPVTAR